MLIAHLVLDSAHLIYILVGMLFRKYSNRRKRDKWLRPLEICANPIDTLRSIVHAT